MGGKHGSLENNKLHFRKVDMLDKTIMLNIKPYIKHFRI
ncbi:MAG: SAM-dependent methyltransferase [Sedimentisphaerales bacterium]|nr:SAM-dependent methyltransferase [Sedimentisphaerales bacterium]